MICFPHGQYHVHPSTPLPSAFPLPGALSSSLTSAQLPRASFDSIAKLWDVELGKLIQSLKGHRDPVYSVAFSPNDEYLTSGSLDRSMHILSLKEGKIVKTYTGNGGVFEVCWYKLGR